MMQLSHKIQEIFSRKNEIVFQL